MAQKTLQLFACLFAIGMGTLASMNKYGILTTKKFPALTALEKKLFQEIYKSDEELNLSVVDELIQNGAHINAVDTFGMTYYTPLMTAIRDDHIRLAQHLMRHYTLDIDL